MSDGKKGKNHRGGAEHRFWSLTPCLPRCYFKAMRILSVPLKNGGQLFSFLASAGLRWPLTHMATMALTDALSEVAGASLMV